MEVVRSIASLPCTTSFIHGQSCFLLLQFFEHLPGVVLWLYFPERFDDRPFLIDQIGGTLDPHDRPAEHPSFLLDVVCL